jgi:hypothetical protein
MKQDTRFLTPHFLPLTRKPTFQSKPTGAGNGSSPSGFSFEELYRQQLERVADIGKPVIACEECRDTGWMTVFCPENGTDIIPCDFCQEEE